MVVNMRYHVFEFLCMNCLACQGFIVMYERLRKQCRINMIHFVKIKYIVKKKKKRSNFRPDGKIKKQALIWVVNVQIVAPKVLL